MPTVTPNSFVYVVKLRGPDFADPARLSGRLEHVMSGRRHDFDNAAALLACLRHEQQQALADTEPDPDPDPDTDTDTDGDDDRSCGRGAPLPPPCA